MNRILNKIYSHIPRKFLIAGAINTIFGYSVGVINLYLLIDIINLFWIGIINNFLSITFAFFVLKNFVFKTKNSSWFFEYLRSFLVYGFSGLIGILVLWVSIHFIKLNFFLSQGAAIISTILISYKNHKNFTFKIKN